MTTLLGEYTAGDPGWLFPRPGIEPCAPEAAATFLRGLDDEDLRLLVLNYGLGMRVGGISQVMRVDPALVVWRMHRSFHRWRHEESGEVDAAALEHGVAQLLRNGSDAIEPPAGATDWSVSSLLHDLDRDVRERLQVRLEQGSLDQPQGSGVGVGLAVVVLAVAIGFLAFGVVRDIDPMARGDSLMRQYEYTRARQAFLKAGTADARKKIVLCLLAEGRFAEASAALESDELRAGFKRFAPGTAPGRIRDIDPGGRALLPRGAVIMRRPEFVIRAGPPATLEVTAAKRVLSLPLPDTRGEGSEFVSVPYPDDWPALPATRIRWSVVDGDQNTAWFDVLGQQDATQIRDRNVRVLTREIPERAQQYLRAHGFMNEGLYMQAGREFSDLMRHFPESQYLAEQIGRLGAVMGIDPGALLR